MVFIYRIYIKRLDKWRIYQVGAEYPGKSDMKQLRQFAWICFAIRLVCLKKNSPVSMYLLREESEYGIYISHRIFWIISTLTSSSLYSSFLHYHHHLVVVGCCCCFSSFSLSSVFFFFFFFFLFVFSFFLFIFFFCFYFLFFSSSSFEGSHSSYTLYCIHGSSFT